LGGGIGVLIILAVGIAAGIAVMLLTLNARWRTAPQLLRQARENVVGAIALAVLGLAAVSIVIFVLGELF
jgi:hypothetical protein